MPGVHDFSPRLGPARGKVTFIDEEALHSSPGRPGERNQLLDDGLIAYLRVVYRR